MFSFDDDDFQPSGSKTDWLDGVHKVNFKADALEPHPYRVFGNLFKYAQHQIRWFSKKKNAETGFPRLCPKHNPETGNLDRVYPQGHAKAGQPVPCPECDERMTPPRFRYLVHAIDRNLQAMGMPNPVRVLDIPESVMIAIWEKKKTNIHGGKQYSMAHPQYGRDIFVTFKPKAPAAQMYSIDKGDVVTPLTAQELAYPTYNFQELYITRGFVQADPEDFRRFLQNVKLLPGGKSDGTHMPTNLTNMDQDNLPSEWGGTLPGGGGGFQAPSVAASGPTMGQGGFGGGGFQPPQFGGGGGGFQPPQSFIPAAGAATEAGPSSRFSGPPQGAPSGVQMPASLPQVNEQGFQAAIAGQVVGPQNAGGTAAGHPPCFRDPDKQGLPNCVKCPSKTACFAD